MNFEDTWEFVMGDVPMGASELITFKAVAKAFYVAGQTAGLNEAGRLCDKIVMETRQ